MTRFFSVVANHLNFACCFCRRGVFRAFWCHVIAYIRGGYRARAGGAQRATAYLVVAKIFVAAVAAYRAYEQLAGCNETGVAVVGVACQV